MLLRFTCFIFAVCLLAATTGNTSPISSQVKRQSVRLTVTKPFSETVEPAGNKTQTTEPCVITSIGFRIGFAPNTTVCPGKRPIPLNIQPEIFVNGTGKCVIGDNPTILELSDASGNFDNPVVLLEGPILGIGGALARVVEDPTRMTYVFPRETPPGTNYLMRFRVLDYNVISVPLGPFTVLPPDNSSITTLVADESACPVQIRAQATGSNMILTGSNGYVYSQVLRNEGTSSVSFPVTQAGTYTLFNINSQPTCIARQQVQVSKNCR